ncbi:MAG TPA: tripartite tricarboxylate transporter TctB family protein [Burkholderiales bacterium]|nr:tripartite tricarboxylate transporter TctB family protein [Burkholderiales bacterium]
MKIANGKDFWAGVMFVAFGAAFMVIAQNYPMGTAVRMGPAYFPTALGGILVVLGAVVLFRGFVSKISNPLVVFPFRAWLFVGGLVLGAIAYYTQVARDAGMLAQFGHEMLSGLAILALFAAFGERSLWVVLFAVVVFGYILKPLGLVAATVALVFISAWGGNEFKWKEVAILAAVLAAFSVASFVYGLGLPMNIWPSVWE